jgi:hypothetical protein
MTTYSLYIKKYILNNSFIINYLTFNNLYIISNYNFTLLLKLKKLYHPGIVTLNIIIYLQILQHLQILQP